MISGTGLYAIIHTGTGRMYVGCGHPSARVYQHFHGHGGNEHLSRAIAKYGKDAFHVHKWDVGSTEEAAKQEQWLVNFFGGRDSGKLFNLKDGGGDFGRPSKAACAAASASLKAAYANGTRVPHMKGKNHTKETKRKMSESAKGCIKSAEHRANLSRSLKTANSRPEVKANRAECYIERVVSALMSGRFVRRYASYSCKLHWKQGEMVRSKCYVEQPVLLTKAVNATAPAPSSAPTPTG